MKAKLLTIVIFGCFAMVLYGWTFMQPPLQPTITENHYSGSANEIWYNEVTAESVQMTGDWHLYIKTTQWPDGRIEYALQAVELKFIHVGLSTRNVIHTAGVTSYRFFQNGGGSLVDIFSVEDPKSNLSYAIHINYHWFVNERGEINVGFDYIYATRD